MGYVFICYARKDSGFVTTLASSFRRRYIPYWLDIEQIKPPDKWDKKIHEGLLNAERLIVVLSPNSVDRDEVANEWSWAIECGIPIIPVYLQTIPTANFPPRLLRIQYIDFRSGNYQDNLNNLVDVLKIPVPSPSTKCGTPTDNDPTQYIKWLEHESWHVRLNAVDTLLKMAAGAGILALIQALTKDENEYVRETVTITLSEIPSEDQFFRQHFTVRLGTGIFERVSLSDGLAPFTDDLLEHQHNEIQTLKPPIYPYVFLANIREEDLSRMRVRYSAGSMWMKIQWSKIASEVGIQFKSSRLSLTIYRGGNPDKQVNVGIIDLKLLASNSHAQEHGFICRLPIDIGDIFLVDRYAQYTSGTNIAFSNIDPVWSILIGSDLYYHYDSFFYRGGLTE